PSPEHGGAGGGVGTGARVDVNTADAEQLESLPGIGPATAAAILSHRERHGPFRSVDDLIDVRGIGEAKLDALRDLVTVGGATVGGGGRPAARRRGPRRPRRRARRAPRPPPPVAAGRRRPRGPGRGGRGRGGGG